MSSVTIEFHPSQLLREAKRAGIAVLLFAAIVMAAHCGTGCKEAQYVPTAREMNYTVDQQACAASAKTKQESQDCRREVDRRYGLCDSPWPRVSPCDE